MGYTRFTGLRGDDFALGGAGRNSPAAYLADPKYVGANLHTGGSTVTAATGSDFSMADSAAPGIARWISTKIGASTPAFSQLNATYSTLTADNLPLLSLVPHNAAAASLGSDFTYHEGTVSVYNPPFPVWDTSSTRPYASENFVEFTMKRGVGAASTWTVGGSWVLGMVRSDTAPGFLTTAGALNLTANFVAFTKVQGASVISMQAAGSSGGVQTLSNTLDFSGATYVDSTFGPHWIQFGVRMVGTQQLEWYVNRRRVGIHRLATGMLASSGAVGMTFTLSAVQGSTSVPNNTYLIRQVCYSAAVRPDLLSYSGLDS